MSIFLLFIPLALFITAEGVILFFLLEMITSALLNNDALIAGIYSAPQAVLFVLLLMTAIGVAIYFYVRLIIKPALIHERKKKKTIKQNNSSAPAQQSQYTGNNRYNPYIAAYNLNIPAASAPRRNSNLKVTGVARTPVRKKSSKKLFIILLIIIFALIIGAVTFAFIFRPDWLPFFGDTNKTNNNGTASDLWDDGGGEWTVNDNDNLNKYYE